MKLPEQWREKLSGLWSRYRYPLIVLMLGLLLVLWPGKQAKSAEVAGASASASGPSEQQSELSSFSEQTYCRQTEQKLEQILGKIASAGRVKVMLTLQSGTSTQYQTDVSSQTSGTGEQQEQSLEQKTVMLSKGSSYNEAAVVKTEYPTFRGALIVCEGGDEPAVRLQIVNAVSALLGLGADKITVVKMN